MDCIILTSTDAKAIILDSIFAKKEWIDQMATLGVSPVLFGIDLEKFDPKQVAVNERNETRNKPPYLALGLVTKTTEHAIGEFGDGFPHKELFFNCLKQWKWANESQCNILIEETNIELNVSEYDRQIGVNCLATAIVNKSDPIRLIRRKPDSDPENPTNYIGGVVHLGDGDPEEMCLVYFGHGSSLMLLKIWGHQSLWQFRDRSN